MHKTLIVLYMILFSCGSCFQKDSKTSTKQLLNAGNNSSKSYEDFHYKLDEPEVIILASVLKEISGLAYDNDTNQLLAHNDEKGRIYQLSLSDGSITNTIRFGKNDDYECIEKIDNQLMIATSDGKINIHNAKTDQNEIIKTELSGKNNIEGMCMNPEKTKLLLACKGQPLKSAKSKNEKAIYEFDFVKKTLTKEPKLLIREDQLVQWINTNFKTNTKSELKKKINRIKDFAPSGISFTYDQEQLFIVSARGSTLIVFDRHYKLRSIHFLNSKTIPQPEGISFDKENNLYISTEGQGFSGKIFKYAYHES